MAASRPTASGNLTMAHLDLHHPAPAPTLLQRVWQQLQSHAERRATRDLARSLGDALDPALSPAQRSAVLEAAALRRMAARYARTDRGYADDLYAAADRHERLAGVDGPPPR